MSYSPRPTVGVVHPGAMGAAVAFQARSNAAEVLWCPAGRSSATRDRAARAGLGEADNVGDLAGRCDIIISLCPPANATEVARNLAKHSFRGLYVEANAIAPTRARDIAKCLGE